MVSKKRSNKLLFYFSIFAVLSIAASIPITARSLSVKQNVQVNAAQIYQSIYVDGVGQHCTPFVNNSQSCWNNVNDVIDFFAIYKKSVKYPNGRLTCWSVPNPPSQFPLNGLDYMTYQKLMATPPSFTKSVAPVPASGDTFKIQPTGDSAAWCRTDFFDGQNILGTGMFGLGAPGQTTL